MANVIRDLVIKVSVDADTKGFTKLDEAQAKTGTGSVAMGNIIANATTKLVELGVAAIKAGAALIKDLVFGTTEAADAVAKTSKQLGIQAEQLQRLSGAAQLSGASTESLEKGVRVLTKGLADSSLRGTGPAADALATLGLTVDDLADGLADGDIESVVGTIGDAFTETEDSIEKSAALMQLFGTAGTKLRPLLEEGSEGVSALGDEIKNVISDEDLAQFEDLADANFLVDDAMQDLKNQIAAGLAPSVLLLSERVGGLIEENEELITQDMPAVLGAVGEGMISLGEEVFELIETWKDFVTEIDNMIERFIMDFPEAVSAVTVGFTVMGKVADVVSAQFQVVADTVSKVVDFILDAVGGIEALEGTVSSLRAGLGLDDDEVRVERGAGAKFASGAANLTRPDQLTPDNSAASLQRIVDGDFSDSDKAIASASLPIAKTREVAAAAESDRAANEASAQANAGKDEARAERARRRAKTSRQRSRGGGGGGGGGGRAAGPAAPTVDELVAGAIGAGGGGPSRVGGANALAGTNLIRVDNSVNITNGPVAITLELPPGAVEAGDASEFAGAIEPVVVRVLAQQNRVDFDRARARRAVGGG